jgi:hypothetical protein
MVRRSEPSVEVWVPKSVALWIRAMADRIGAPAHMVIHVLLDRYLQRLPPASREKFEERLRRWRERTTQ